MLELKKNSLVSLNAPNDLYMNRRFRLTFNINIIYSYTRYLISLSSQYIYISAFNVAIKFVRITSRSDHQ